MGGGVQDRRILEGLGKYQSFYPSGLFVEVVTWTAKGTRSSAEDASKSSYLRVKLVQITELTEAQMS